MEKEKDGVWRTIRGRRIFIGKGESLGEAMAKSGKFKREDIRTAKTQLRRADRAEKTLQQPDNTKLRHKMTNKGLRHERDVFENKQAEKNRINENEPQRVGNTREEKNYFRYSEADRRELSHEKIQKKLADYKAKKQSNNKIDIEKKVDNEIKRMGSNPKTYNLDAREDIKNNIKGQENTRNELSKKGYELKRGETINYKDDKGNIQKGTYAGVGVNGEVYLDNKDDDFIVNETHIKNIIDKQSNNKIETSKGKYDDNIKNANDKELYDMSKGWAVPSNADDLTKKEQAEIKRLAKEEIKARKQSNNKVETERELYERAKNNPDSIDPMTENSTDWEALEKKYGKVDPYDDPESNESQRLQSIQSRYDEYLQDTEGRGASYGEIAYVDSLRGKDLDDFEKELDDYETKKYDKQEKTTKKTKTDEKDWLPKATEIKEQGTSNRKQVSDNIQAHILEHYSPDFTGDDDVSAEEAFIRQMDAMSWLPNNWKRGEEIAKGGSYLVYNQDMADFLDTLKINPKGKKFDSNKSFDTYVSLIGRESAKLYDKIKKHQAETINNYKKRKGK